MKAWTRLRRAARAAGHYLLCLARLPLRVEALHRALVDPRKSSLRAVLDFLLLKEIHPELTARMFPPVDLSPESLRSAPGAAGAQQMPPALGEEYVRLLLLLARAFEGMDYAEVAALQRQAIRHAGRHAEAAYHAYVYEAHSRAPDDRPVLEACDELERLPEAWKPGLRDTWVYVLDALLRDGQTERAERLLARFRAAYGPERLSAVMPVAAFARARGVADPWVARSAALHDEVARARDEDVLGRALRGRRVAVVGNAPGVRGRGAEIDAHDAVVRVNRLGHDARYAPDYGARTTVCMKNLAFTPKGTKLLFGGHEAWDGVLCLVESADITWLSRPAVAALHSRVETGRLRLTAVTAAERRRWLAACGGVYPSAGLSAVAVVKSYCPELAARNLYGFSFLGEGGGAADGEWGTQYHYDRPDQRFPPHPHNLARERELALRLLAGAAEPPPAARAR